MVGHDTATTIMITEKSDTEDESTDNETLDELEGMFERRSLDDMSVDVNGNPDEYPLIKSLARDVNRHGEAHVCVEEHDNELEVRVGTCYFNFETGVLHIKTEVGHGNLKVGMDRVVSWYKPHNAFH